MLDFSPSDLKNYLDAATEKPLILDVREPWEYEKASLDNSLLVPMRELPTFVKELQPERSVIDVCHHGIRSRAVCRYLEDQNFTNVINLFGGLDAWAKSVDPDMPTY